MNKKLKYLDYIRMSKGINEDGTNKKLKVGVLRSFTVETINPILKVKLNEEKIYGEIFVGEYNQYYKEIYDKESEFYKFKPDICIMAIRLEEMYPKLIKCFIDEKDNLINIQKYIVEEYKKMILQIKENSNCYILINNFILPANNYSSLYDFHSVNGQANFIRKLNLALVEVANMYTGVYVVDTENIASLLGKLNIVDERMWHISKNPYKSEFYESLSSEYVKYIKAIYGLKKKCIILDLDNTLWGGVIGEDGLDGIKLGGEYPGSCYRDFQSALLGLKKRGVILAICSKNNIGDVDEVFEKHPDMILKKDDFANIKVNWQDKFTNIESISKELNIGLDSIVFIDDSPTECELIKQKLPDVTTINLSNNPLEYVSCIQDMNYFETLNFTDEDLKKTDYYKEQLDRANFKNSVNNLDDFYRSLQIKVEIREADDFSIPRIAQLTQKTNQFNLTTKRYTEEEIKELAKDSNYKIYYIRVIDRFGDSGITGCCILNQIDISSVYVDTLLLSCRVIGRNIEKAFISYICSELRDNNVVKIIGEYIPTKKNIPVKDFYKDLGFQSGKDSKYYFDMGINKIECPDYIEIV